MANRAPKLHIEYVIPPVSFAGAMSGGGAATAVLSLSLSFAGAMSGAATAVLSLSLSLSDGIYMRIAFSTNPFSSPVWNDVSKDLMSLSVRRGRQYELNRMEVGTSIVQLLNINGDYWPTNTSGAYYPNVLPYKRINIRVAYGGTVYDVYTGFIEEYQPDFILKPIKGPVMKLSCVDLSKSLSRYKINDAVGYSSELSGIRIANVLGELAWPTSSQNLQAGQSTMQSTGPIVNMNAIDHIYDVTDSERGIFINSPSGDAVFKDRYDRLLNQTTSAATFGDTGAVLHYQEIKPSYGDKYIYNDIRLQRTGGVEQVSTSTTSQDSYGARTYQEDGLLLTADAEVLDQASYLKSRFENPELRVKSITIRPSENPAELYPKALGFDLSERITVQLSQASLNKDYYIEGISHDWNAKQPQMWKTTWDLSTVDNQTYWVLGDVVNGILGSTTRLAY